MVTFALFSYRNFAIFCFFFAYDEQIGDAFELVVAYFATDFLVAVIDDGTDIEVVELFCHLVCVVVELLADGEDDSLVGSEPEGEAAGGVLEQHGHETLHRAEGRAVNHHGTVLLVVGAGVFELEALGQVVVHLDGAELPAAADGVLDHEVEFGTVECGFAKLGAGFESFLGAGFDDGLLGEVPVFVATDVFLLVFGVAERDLSLEVLEVESLEDVEDDVHHLEELVLDLVGSAEDVGVVLRKAAHAGQAVELAALLVAVDGAELGKAQGQVAVRAGSGAEYLAVVGAVHRLEQVLLALLGGVDGLERVLAIFGIVARGDIEVLVADMRGDHLLVAVLFLYLAQELLETVAQGGTFGQPKGQALADVGREGKKFHLFAQFAVVAFFSFFEHDEVFVEHLLFGEGDTVNAHKLVALFIAAPVGTGQRCDLHSLDGRCVGDMRTTAQVGEVALCIGGDVAILEFADELTLVCLAAVAEHLQGVSLGDVATHDVVLLTGEFEHLLFDAGHSRQR